MGKLTSNADCALQLFAILSFIWSS